MSKHAQTKAEPMGPWRRTLLVGASIAAVAVAGGTATQAFATGGHGAAHTSGHQSAHAVSHPGRSGHAAHAAASAGGTTSLADAITSVVPGTVSDQTSQSDVFATTSKALAPGLERPISWSALQFAPGGGSGQGTVYAFFDKPDSTGAKAIICGDDPESGYTWQSCQTSTLPDGSQAKTAVSSDGEAALVEHIDGGVVERVYAFAPSKGAGTVLSTDQLTKVVAELTPPAS